MLCVVISHVIGMFDGNAKVTCARKAGVHVLLDRKMFCLFGRVKFHFSMIDNAPSS